MSNNYPPGITGSEFAIAGPDYERESDELCPACGSERTLELGYRSDRWLYCEDCQIEVGLEIPGPDPDRAHDEAVERRLFGDD